MANEYFVNSADLTSVADAIRAKGETTETLVFPGGFVAAIAGMETGKTGATLTVTTPAEGVTVTVAKGETSYTKTTGADGTAVFPGLESGTWTITISDGSQTATGTVNIDVYYTAELTFFAATINVTYPEGLVCKATDGVKTLTAPDTSGTWDCVVHNSGTWKVSLENGFYETVEITQDGETHTIDKWYLYNSGDERTYITGGWAGRTFENGGSTSKTSTTLVAVANSSGYNNAGFSTINKIDVSVYRTLKMQYDLTGEESNLALTNTYVNSNNGWWDQAANVSLPAGTGKVAALSLAEGSYYILFFRRNGSSSGSQTRITCHKVWLE